MATVFVGIPTRNRPDLAPEAILSVLNQTVGDFRLLVSDNASEEPAARSLARFVRELADPRVSYYLQPTNVGEYGQGRFFLENCREEYFVILHDDDRLEPRYLEVALRHMEDHPWAACFAANPYIFTTRGRRDRKLTERFLAAHGRFRFPPGPIDILEPLLRCGFIPITGAFFRTAALQASGFVDEDCQGNYPFEFNVFLRLGERNERAYFSTEQLLGIRFHERSMRRTLRLKFNEHVIPTMLKLVERRRFAGASERLRQRILAYLCRNYAVILLARGESRLSRRYLLRAVQLNPFSYRNWTYSAAALLFPFLLRPLLRSKVDLAVPG
jgi:glycosyltransferase involved in cell wall biosynthesis